MPDTITIPADLARDAVAWLSFWSPCSAFPPPGSFDDCERVAEELHGIVYAAEIAVLEAVDGVPAATVGA